MSPKSTHSILLIEDNASHDKYLLDPSFHRYGALEDFEEYLFFGYSDTIIGIKNREPDVRFEMDTGTPLLILHDFISYLQIGSVDGKFDKNNFILSVKAHRRYKYTGRYIFALRKKDGVTEAFEDKWLQNQALTSKEIEQLKKILLKWFAQLE